LTKSFSLHSRAVGLVLLAILPLFALTLYSYFNQRDAAIREVQRDELVAVKNIAATLQTLVTTTRNLLISVAQLPQVQRLDRDGCHALFTRIMEHNPYYSIIAVVDANGQLVASNPQSAGVVNYTDRRWFQQAVKTRTFFLGEMVLGRVSRRYNFNLSYPIEDDQGRLQGVVTAALDLQWLGGLLVQSGFPPTAATGLTDSSHKILFRYPDPLKYIGRSIPKSVIQAMAASDEGVTEGTGTLGDERLLAFTTLAPPWQEMRVVMGVPRDWAIAPVNRLLWRNLGWLGLVAVFAMIAAWCGGEWFVVRPVRKLRILTDSLSAGDLTVRIGPEYTVGELGLLAHSFDRMAASLQERQKALQERSAELAGAVAELEESNAEMERFTYMISHDLKSPLVTITTFLGYLEQDLGSGDANRINKDFQYMYTAAGKMRHMLDELLEVSRIGRIGNSSEKFNFREVVQEVIATVAGIIAERDVQIELRDEDIPLFGDRSRLAEIWQNLLENAIKYMGRQENPRVAIGLDRQGGEVIFWVCDNGMGIDPRYQQKIFGIFEKLDAGSEGTGIGLALVKRIVELNKGTIWVESAGPGQGCCFRFTLPGAVVD
jgi:signal transduction histidine kinase